MTQRDDLRDALRPHSAGCRSRQPKTVARKWWPSPFRELFAEGELLRA